MFRKRNSLELC